MFGIHPLIAVALVGGSLLVTVVVWCLCKIASDADDQMERLHGDHE